MKLEQWDKKVAPFLQLMEHKAGWIKQDTNNLLHDVETLASAVDQLPCRPEFETMAVAALIGAEGALIHTLERVRALKDEYSNKPSEHKYFEAAE